MNENLPAKQTVDVITQLQNMEGQFKAALPPHVPVERFTRVVMTAINGNPDLRNADKRTLFESAMKAAQDGLLPDGRDGAFVIFNSKDKEETRRQGRDVWVKRVQWMPMIGGILKKVRNSGELVTISAYVAYTKDRFTYILGDDEKIEHEPSLDEDRGRPRLVYAIAKTKDGGIYREVMTIAEVEKVRNVSRARDSGPWKDWWDEMAKKTVLRRLAKRLPTSADLDDLIRRDDDLYDFKGQREDAPPLQTIANPLRDELPASAGAPAIEHQTSDDEQDERQDDPPADQNGDPGPGSDHRDGAGRDGETDYDSDAGPDDRITSGPQGGQRAPQEGARASEASKATTTAKPAQTSAAAKPATPRTDWESEEDYVEWFRDLLDKARTASAVKDEWARTRDVRRELLGSETLEKLETDKNVAVDRLKGGR